MIDAAFALFVMVVALAQQQSADPQAKAVERIHKKPCTGKRA